MNPVQLTHISIKVMVRLLKKIVGGVIGTTFITLVGAHWMLLHKRTSIGLDTFILSCDNPPDITLKINRNIGNNRSFNEDKIPSTAEFQFETRPITIYMDPYQNNLEILMERSCRNRDAL